MKSILFSLLLLTLAITLPRRQRQNFEYPYTDILISKICSNLAPVDKQAISIFRSTIDNFTAFRVDFSQIIFAQQLSASKYLTFSFKKLSFRPYLLLILSIGVFAAAPYMWKKKPIIVKKTRQQVEKDKDTITQVKTRYHHITKFMNIGLILVLLLAAVLCIHGIFMIDATHQAATHMICSVLKFPKIFSKENATIITVSQYHNLAIVSRQFFVQLKQNLTELSHMIKQKNIVARSKLALGDPKAIEAVQAISEGIIPLYQSSQEIVGAALYLRELYYWLRIIFSMIPSFIDDYYPFQQLPNLFVVPLYATNLLLLVLFVYLIVKLILRWPLKARSFRTFKKIIKLIMLALLLLAIVCSFGELLLNVGFTASQTFPYNLKKGTIYRKMLKPNGPKNTGLTEKWLGYFIDAMQPGSKKGYIRHNSDAAELVLSSINIAASFNTQNNLDGQSQRFIEGDWLVFQKKLKQTGLAISNVQHTLSSEGQLGRLSLWPFGQFYRQLHDSVFSYNLIKLKENINNFIKIFVLVFFGLLLCLLISQNFGKSNIIQLVDSPIAQNQGLSQSRDLNQGQETQQQQSSK